MDYKKNIIDLKRNYDNNNMEKLSNPIIEMNNIDYSNMTKEDVIKIMIEQQQKLLDQIAEQKMLLDRAKHENKPESSNVTNQPESEDEADEMKDIMKSEDDQEMKLDQEATTTKYNRLFQKSETITYPKQFVSIDRFRRDEVSIAGNGRSGSSFVNLFENRMESIKGTRETISITLNVDITDEETKITESSNYGPFQMEIPKLKKKDMYKFFIYTLLVNKFNLLSAQVISQIGAEIITYNPKFFEDHKMGRLKLELYLLSNINKIKSRARRKNTCVLDYIWSQVRGQKGFKYYTYEKLKEELYSYAQDAPFISTQEIISWARECHPNVSVHAYDSTYKKFITHTSNSHTDVTLVYIVKDYHCYPITNEKLKLVATMGKGGAKDLLKHMTDIKWTRRHDKVYELQSLEEVTFANKDKSILILPEDVRMYDAITKYVNSSKFYVEFLHWNNTGILDGFIDHKENMYLLNDNYQERKSICNLLFDKFKTHDFVWTNQSFTSLSSALFRQITGYLEESNYNTKTRQILDDFYPRALQYCTPDDIPDDVISIDISKSYPSILINNESPIPIYGIHNVIEPFVNEHDLKQYGEFYLEETIIDNFNIPIKIESGFYSKNLVNYLVYTLNMPIERIKRKLTTKRTLKSDTFRPFLIYVFSKFPEKQAKLMANSLIGDLGRKYNRTNTGFTCTEYETAMCCWTRAMAEGRNVTINNFNDIYLIKEQTCKRIFSDNTSINRFVVSEAILQLLKLINDCNVKNSKLYAYNTDGIFITNPNPDLKLKNKKNVSFKLKHIGKPFITNTELVYFEKKFRENLDYESYTTTSGNGQIYIGQAGSGKTTKLCEMVKQSENPLVLSYTNKAIENIKKRLGDDYKDKCHTFDSYFCEWRETDTTLKTKTIFIDELSMVPNKWITKIYEIFVENNNKIFMFGDPNQCLPVEGESQIKYDYLNSASILEMCPEVNELTYIEESCRYDKQTHNMLSVFLKQNKVTTYINPIGEYNKNICYLNKTRKRVTEECCNRFTKDKHHVAIEFKYDNGKETYKICEGIPLIATVNNKDRKIYNTMEFTLDEIDSTGTTFMINDEIYDLSEFSRSFIPGFCVTVYKYQGADINENYNIHDVGMMDKKQLYTALSRTTKFEFLHLNFKELNKEYKIRGSPDVELVNVKNSKYIDGKIYKVTFNDDKIYIGSTCDDLDKRLKSHLTDKNSIVYKNKHNNPEIELLVYAPCYDKKTLEKIENGYIDEYAEKYQNELLNVRCNPKKKQKKIEFEVYIENDKQLRQRIAVLEKNIQIKDNTEKSYWYFDNVVDGIRHQTKSRYVDNSKEQAFEKINKKKHELIKQLTITFE